MAAYIVTASALWCAVTLTVWTTITTWILHHPADSTALEQGHASGTCMAVLIWVCADVWAWQWLARREASRADSGVGRAFDGVMLTLAAWMMVSAVVNADGGDWRSSTNEAWWWVASAGWLASARRLVRQLPVAGRSMIGTLLAMSGLLMVITVHQMYVSLPQTLQQFLADPAATLSALGMDAAENSSQRMVLENRLRDGGPTATFALANSLAGVLVMSTVASISLAAMAWRRQTARWQVAALSIVAAGLGWSVYLTGSRGGMAAIVVASALTARRPWWHSLAGRIRSVPVWAIIVIVSLLTVTVFLTMSTQVDALAGTVPPSLAYRLQYWRATLAMVSDHGLTGVGPGNFQIAYQRYRDVDAHETIAEPHHFWFESLAAGGWPAGMAILVLVGLVIAMRLTVLPSQDNETTDANEDEVRSTQRLATSVSVVMGVVFGIALVWSDGLVSGEVPDVDAMLLGMAAAILFAIVWARMDLRHQDVSQAAAMGLFAGMLHLCLSGGWTIPGVTVFLIWLAALATGLRVPSQSDDRAKMFKGQRSWQRWGIPVAWSFVAIVMWQQSYRPQRQASRALATAQAELRGVRVAPALVSIDEAMQSDPYAIEPALWLVSLLNERSLTIRPDSGSSPKFSAAVESLRQRVAHDPKWNARLGEIYVHRYQVTGQGSDLRAAWDCMAVAISGSPVHQAYVAQAAEIARELDTMEETTSKDWSRRAIDWPIRLAAVLERESGIIAASTDPPSAAGLAQWAQYLGQSGGVLTRDLSLQWILPATPLRREEVAKPRRQPADQMMAAVIASETPTGAPNSM
ncbi:MAG: O-antigen ligase family protein [Planctomycetota bacterium]